MTIDEMYGLMQIGLVVLSFLILILIFVRLSYEREDKTKIAGI
ncbi:MAG: hypothetical protein ACFFFT_16045 [Candidatus Thorarchaeota archaeon]